MNSYKDLCNLFEIANDRLLKKDKKLFTRDVSEPGICGALMLHLYDLMREYEGYIGYYIDLEYNRNIASADHLKKVIIQNDGKERKIKCDLLIHSRGENIQQDNLLALEMKKAYRSKKDKQADRDRLAAMTMPPSRRLMHSEPVLPAFVCGYVLGIYYELDIPHDRCWVEYFQNGQSEMVYEISLVDNSIHVIECLPWLSKIDKVV